MCLIGTMPRFIQIDTWFFGIIHCIWFENSDYYFVSLSLSYNSMWTSPPLSTFLMLKTATKAMKPDFLFFAFTQKSNNYWCFFYLKVVPLGPSSCKWIKIRFFQTLWCLEQKKRGPEGIGCLWDPFLSN